ncbi:MAG: PHP domain-containing protein [Bacillota bacterium]|nr:PHP domain-containing protein [Bacillota bacterium]MDI7249205.1 PHP domain-containing protein [Bacillota bacterium]
MPRLRRWRADLHVHTALSPCADDDMSPWRVVAAAQVAGLDLIAVTDHNSCRQVRAVVEVGKMADLAVLPGMEVQTREDVHLVCLFDTVEQAESWGEEVYEHLPARRNPEQAFGKQLLFDTCDRLMGKEERLLLTACDLGVEQVVARVTALGGVVVPAHVDRQAYGLVYTLGFLPPGLDLLAAEISGREAEDAVRARFPQLGGIRLYAASDAHRLEEIGLHPSFLYLREPTVAELGLAFRGVGGRRVGICPG